MHHGVISPQGRHSPNLLGMGLRDEELLRNLCGNLVFDSKHHHQLCETGPICYKLENEVVST